MSKKNKLSELSDKWIQLRKQAEEAAVNFLVGLLGSSDPIFLERDDVANHILPEGSDYIIGDTNWIAARSRFK